MDNYEATEIAYKNGYEAGKKDAFKWMVKFMLTLIGFLVAACIALEVLL